MCSDLRRGGGGVQPLVLKLIAKMYIFNKLLVGPN